MKTTQTATLDEIKARGTVDCPLHHVAMLRMNEDEATHLGIAMGCPECTIEMAERRSMDDMTRVERIDELRSIIEGPITIAPRLLRQRVNLLAGRPVLLVEYNDVDRLAEQIRSGYAATVDDLIAFMERLEGGPTWDIVRG